MWLLLGYIMEKRGQISKELFQDSTDKSTHTALGSLSLGVALGIPDDGLLLLTTDIQYNAV